MRRLWVAPWVRPLARVYAEALRALGTQVLVVTSEQHHEHAGTAEHEVVVTGGPPSGPRGRSGPTWW